MNTPIECERKFLIRYPDLNLLKAQKDVRISEIVQTYLTSPQGITDRVRARTALGKTTYTRTRKIRVSVLSAEEYESEISEETYKSLLQNADPERSPICKTRFVLPCGKHFAEIDIYPFWQKQAILEIELQSEEEAFTLPSFVEIIREVSADKRYKNACLAREIPAEESL